MSALQWIWQAAHRCFGAASVDLRSSKFEPRQLRRREGGSMKLVSLLVLFLVMPTFADAGCGRIQALAQEHSNNMARRDRMDHDGMESRRARGALAENVAIGCKTKACAMQQWRNSPAHNANMNLPSSAYPCKMVASATSRSGTTYWTMEIGDDEAKAKLRKAKAAKSRAARGWSSSQ
jgi:hypothetical protein